MAVAKLETLVRKSPGKIENEFVRFDFLIGFRSEGRAGQGQHQSQ
jgi:hypothetical protein